MISGLVPHRYSSTVVITVALLFSNMCAERTNFQRKRRGILRSTTPTKVPHRILYRMLCSVKLKCGVQCAVCSVQCAVCSVQCAVCSAVYSKACSTACRVRTCGSSKLPPSAVKLEPSFPADDCSTFLYLLDGVFDGMFDGIFDGMVRTPPRSDRPMS